MGQKTAVLGLVLLIALFLVKGQGLADKRPSTHAHEKQAPQGATVGGDGQTMEGHTHQHDMWETPPAEYASVWSIHWDDPVAIAHGQQLFQTYCLVCHGTDGKGTGPAAVGLPHPPADLTHHFHRAPGYGDAYLLWRVSEGGQVEPFHSMQSTMPAFKTVLTEDERWDVLAYVHAKFHGGFLPTSVTGEGKVISVEPGSEELVVRHGELKGYMGPMTMGYRVSPPSLLKRVNVGDADRFTIDPEQKAIVKLEKLPQ